MVYVLKCNMQHSASANLHVEIAQKLVHVYNLRGKFWNVSEPKWVFVCR